VRGAAAGLFLSCAEPDVSKDRQGATSGSAKAVVAAGNDWLFSYARDACHGMIDQGSRGIGGEIPRTKVLAEKQDLC